MKIQALIFFAYSLFLVQLDGAQDLGERVNHITQKSLSEFSRQLKAAEGGQPLTESDIDVSEILMADLLQTSIEVEQRKALEGSEGRSRVQQRLRDRIAAQNILEIKRQHQQLASMRQAVKEMAQLLEPSQSAKAPTAADNFSGLVEPSAATIEKKDKKKKKKKTASSVVTASQLDQEEVVVTAPLAPQPEEGKSWDDLLESLGVD